VKTHVTVLYTALTDHNTHLSVAASYTKPTKKSPSHQLRQYY